MADGIVLVGAVLAGTVVLFVSDRVRVDLVALLACLALAWLGVITPVEAISGFASNAVIAVAAVMVLGRGIELTGATARLAGAIVRSAGTAERRIVFLVSVTVGLLSSVMNNIGAAAFFLPAVRRIGKQARIPVSRLLMPMGFAAILGGTVTMIGSGPMIILNDLLRQAGAEPFPLFAATPIGFPLLIGGVALFALAGDRILPTKDAERHGPTVAEIWGITHPVRVCRIPSGSPLDGTTREEVLIKGRYDLVLLAMRGNGDITVAPSRWTRFGAGQELAFLGPEHEFLRFSAEYGCVAARDGGGFSEILDSGGFGFAELVVRPNSSIIGRTPRQIMFRKEYSLEPIVHQHGETETRADVSDIRLAAGDIIVAYGSWESLGLLANHRDLLLITPPAGTPVRLKKARPALLIFAGSLALAMAGIPLSLSLLTGGVAMILAGVLGPDEAYRAVDWKTVVLIAGLIPLGIALQKSGAAGMLAGSLTGMLQGVHPLVFLFAVALLATLLSLIISNVAATVLLVPLVMASGAASGLDPRALALLVAICTDNSFILPTHQVNAFLMGQGGYSTADYLKAGGIMTVVFIAIAVTLIYFLF